MTVDRRSPSDSSPTETIDLAGQWNFSLDPDDIGVESNWYECSLEEAISLPGTTDEADVGKPTTGRDKNHLTRTWRYEGAAWYQRTITIPQSWEEKRVTLILERSRKTTLWVNEIEVGTQRSLSTPHEYDLSAHVSPGTHTLTIRVDNGSPPITCGGVKRSHQATDETQTNWNGILGEIQLQATDPVWIDDVQITFEDDDPVANIDLCVGNSTEDHVVGEIQTRIPHRLSDPDEPDPDSSGSISTSVCSNISISPGNNFFSIEHRFFNADYRWDEFNPGFEELVVELTAVNQDDNFQHATTLPFSRCTFKRDGTQFSANGRTTFLRGTVDCCVFPETGYAPMSTDEWRSVFETGKQYGLNHYRFHSWCPPEAAFIAADELGIYLQPELPFWGELFESDDVKQFYYDESEAILDAYANHPSFVLFALGNELSGSKKEARRLVSHCRDHDSRLLYATGSNSFHDAPTLVDGDDFWVTMMTSGAYDPGSLDASTLVDGPVRGSFSPHTVGHVNNTPPATTVDYSDSIEDIDVPVISHEIGQYQVYPSYDEIEKYSGILEPRNLAVFRDHLEAHGMAGCDDAFHRASGQLASACYREEVEAALRTQGFGGFQLLGLQDFPGQGTALVGLFNAFMDDKGIIEPEIWRESCDSVVALAQMSSRIWTVENPISATIQIANYGPDALSDVIPYWELRSTDGEQITSGQVEPATVGQGNLDSVATVEIPTASIAPPAKRVLEVGIKETSVSNTYDVWVFPSALDPSHDDVVMHETYDVEAREHLQEGKTVLFLAPESGWEGALDGAFQPDYWAYGSEWKRRQAPPGTMGLHIDSDHPALSAFPTDHYSDWQWWHISKRSNPVVLDDLPDEYRPIVQAIDNVERNQKLGVIFEGSVGDGTFLACAADLRSIGEPEADQLLYSLINYVQSDAFDPITEFSERQMAKLIR